LPTEAEWEYAARGGSAVKNCTGGCEYSGSNNIGEVAWYSGNSYALGSGHPDYGTHPVGTKAANELGIFDMSGNVWEWCCDWYAAYSSGAVSNPTGPIEGSNRVYRGGSWSLGAAYARVASRSHDNPGYRYSDLGFRLACSSN
jgi:formylglycine-generating enzyme required for sulfatase activity